MYIKTEKENKAALQYIDANMACSGSKWSLKGLYVRWLAKQCAKFEDTFYNIGGVKPQLKVSFYGLHCYMNDDTEDMWACNPSLDWLIPKLSSMHNFFTEIACAVFPNFEPKGFPLKVLETYED